MFEAADPFFVRALVAGVLLAAVAAPMGCIVVWRRMAYAGETLAQASLLGVALGTALGTNLTLAIVAAAMLAAMALTALGRQRLVATDSLLGLLHHGALAIAVIAISLVKGLSADLLGFLFGDIFAVTKAELLWAAGLSMLILAAVSYLWQPLVRLSVHADLAAAEGVDPLVPPALFDILLAVTIALAMKIVGALLVMAFLVVPAVAARPLSETPERMAVLAALIGVVSAAAGLFASLAWDIPGGPAIVLAMALLAAISLLAGGRAKA